MGYPTVTLRRPGGSVMTSGGSSGGKFNLPSQTLPTTGTYTLVIDPGGAATGSIHVRVTSP